MIRRRPSTVVVSLLSACMLSRVRAFASIFSVFFSAFLASWDGARRTASSMSRWAYQTPSSGMSANSRIAVR